MKAQQAGEPTSSRGGLMKRAKKPDTYIGASLCGRFQDSAGSGDGHGGRGATEAGENRTRMNEMKFQKRDYAAIVMMALVPGCDNHRIKVVVI